MVTNHCKRVGLCLLFLSCLTIGGCGQLDQLSKTASDIQGFIGSLDFDELSRQITAVVNELRSQSNMRGLASGDLYSSGYSNASSPVDLNQFLKSHNAEVKDLAYYLVNQSRYDPSFLSQLMSPSYSRFGTDFGYDAGSGMLYPYYYLGR